jgi:tetratricopeptide (TPR) repeat protein
MAQYYEAFEKTDNPEHPMTWFKAAVTADPENLATRQVVAIWALQKGNIPMVKEQAEAALRIEAADAAKPINERLYPGSNVGRMLRGLVALWEKDWVEAENYFQKVILESPNDFGARNNLALALVEQDDQQKKQRALAYAEANYRENNNSPDALSTLGWVYFRRNEFDQAGLALEQALKATNGQLNNADTATYVAHILYHQDRKYQAKQILEGILGAKSRPFSMKPEAQRLYEKVKDAVAPAAAKTP